MEKDIIKVDSCIIGGSVAGLWTALDLAKRGQKVLVVDKTYIGHEKRHIDVCLHYMCEEELRPITLKAQKKWFDLKDIYEHDFSLELRGSLSFALSHEDEQHLNILLEQQKDLNEDTAAFILKDKQAIKTLIKARDIGEQVKSAFISVDDMSIDHQACLDFLRQNLIKAGAQFWGSDEVIDFEIEEGNITGLVTKESIIKADNIILASGARSKILLERLGLKMPLRPAKSHIIEYTSKVKMPTQLLHYKSHLGDYICKPMLNGRNQLIYTGSEDQMQATWSKAVNKQTANSSMLEMVRVLPILEYADVQEIATVQIAISPDRLPYFGKSRFYKNLYLNIGLNGLNYMLAPYFAEKMASLVTSNYEDSELEFLNPDRFMPEDYEIDYASIENSEHTLADMNTEFEESNGKQID
jgi:glycine/D-amino acid oxidase-like deaminating enzyme